MMTPFDLLSSPLEGRNLIEASAGTGKTYTIAGLYLRLLLEKRLSVDQILVVTFTVAATEELRGRIRRRIREALAAFESANSDQGSPVTREALSAFASASSDQGSPVAQRASVSQLSPVADDFLAGLVEKCDDLREALILLTNALRCFDEAVVFTIHGFCQRTLQEKAFECSSFFNTELITDQSDLMQEVVDDFWRIHAYDASPDFVNYAGNRWSPASLATLARAAASRLNVLRVIPEIDVPQTKGLEDACTRAFDQMRQVWPGVRQEVEDLLVNSSQGLHQRKYPQAAIRGWVEKMDKYLAAGDLFPYPGQLQNFGITALEGALKKGCQPPRHQFFILADDLHARLKELEAAFDLRLLALKRRLLDFIREELPRRKQEHNIRSFDDLLLSLQAALKATRPGGGEGDTGEGGTDLARIIREKYRAALIDEFQDTDPIQYDIFKTIYPDRKSILFLIGDPKQAIYSFRGADVFAYLEAAKDVEARYTLDTNWRSVPDLIRAVNAIFSNRESPFIFENIPFHPVNPPPGVRERTEQIFCPRQEGLLEGQGGTGQTHISCLKVEGRGHGLEIDGGLDSAPLQLWFVAPRPGESQSGESQQEDVRRSTLTVAASGKRINKEEARKQLPEAVASEIGRLLRAGQKGQARIDCHRASLGRQVTTGDIAVLVRTNDQARTMQEALHRRGIPSVLYSSESLFSSREASELLKVLTAVAEPGCEEKIKAALVTDMMGLSGNELASLVAGIPCSADRTYEAQSYDAQIRNFDAAAWGKWLEKFRAYHELWARHREPLWRQGFMIMASTLIAQEKVKSRLLVYRDGERRVTNLLHCLEVLHQAALENNFGIEGLVKWFTRQINDNPEKEEYQIRLETDEKAVKLVTIHKSKGLEYEIVFCPFCWSGVREEKELAFFHDPAIRNKTTLVLGSQTMVSGQLPVDRGNALPTGDRGNGLVTDQRPLTTAALESARSLARKEILAEDLRLLYVALTRARQRCYLVWGAIGRPEASALAYLLHPCHLNYDLGSKPRLACHCESGKKGADNHNPVDVTAATGDPCAWLSRLDNQKMLDDLDALAQKAQGAIRVCPVPDACEDTYEAVDDHMDMLSCRPFSASIPNDWHMVSLSSLVSGREEWSEGLGVGGAGIPWGGEGPGLDESHPFEDAGGKREISAEKQGGVKNPGHSSKEDDRCVLDFPRGTRAGTCLHDILEGLDFAERTPDATEKLVQERLAAHGFDQAWTPLVCSMLDRVLAIPLMDRHTSFPQSFIGALDGALDEKREYQESKVEDFTLYSLTRSDRVQEMEFYLPLERITSSGLRAIFESYGRSESIPLKQECPPAQGCPANPLEGRGRGGVMSKLSSESWTQGGSAAIAARRQQRLGGNSDWPPGNVPRLVAGQCPSIGARAISLGVENPGHSSKCHSSNDANKRITVPKGLVRMLERLNFTPARGLLKGYIDLVFRFEGRYYLVDYKSNYLGPRLENYSAQVLSRVMEREYYLLQYHLYTVALHKYLARRVPDYDYQTHFGGVFYIFLRGIDPGHGPGFGIYRDRPAKALIDSLDRYFSGGIGVLT